MKVLINNRDNQTGFLIIEFGNESEKEFDYIEYDTLDTDENLKHNFIIRTFLGISQTEISNQKCEFENMTDLKIIEAIGFNGCKIATQLESFQDVKDWIYSNYKQTI